jgi:hypothetical protein
MGMAMGCQCEDVWVWPWGVSVKIKGVIGIFMLSLHISSLVLSLLLFTGLISLLLNQNKLRYEAFSTKLLFFCIEIYYLIT